MEVDDDSIISLLYFSGRYLNLKWLKAEPWATAYGGSFAFNTPMLYALGFVFLFTIGGFYLLLVRFKGYVMLE